MLWTKELSRIPQKITALIPIFCLKNVYSLKIPCSHYHILSKKRLFSQKRDALMSLLQLFHEKRPVAMPIIGRKKTNSVKTTVFNGPKKTIACPFSMVFYEKITTLSLIFCQKKIHSLKTRSSHAHYML